MWLRLVVFLVLNFGALAIGSWLMGGSPATNAWYVQLDKAPWTPPGWVFGAAWFTIMALFAWMMARITEDPSVRRTTGFIYALQLVLNIGWNPVFFRWHLPVAGLVILLLLLATLIVLLLSVPANKKSSGWLLLPYVVWLCIAISLNAYPLV